jgi:hypothetical protein
VALGDPAEVGVGGPHRAGLVLRDEQAHRPVEPRRRVGGEELRAQRRVAELEQRRRPQRDACGGRELGLIDRLEEQDALGSDVLLDARDGLVDRVGALRTLMSPSAPTACAWADDVIKAARPTASAQKSLCR